MADLHSLMAQAKIKEAKRTVNKPSPATIEAKQEPLGDSPKLPRGLRPDNIARLHPELFVNFKLEESNKLITNRIQSGHSLKENKSTKEQLKASKWVSKEEKNINRDTVTDTVRDTVTDTKRITVWNTVRDTTFKEDTVRDTVTDTVRDTVTDTVKTTSLLQYINELPEQQKKAMLYLNSIRDIENHQITRPVGYTRIASILGCKKAVAQKCINRLIEKGLIVRIEKFNKLIKGTVYLINKVRWDTDTVRDTVTDTRSSSSYKTTTTEEGEINEKLQSAVERFGLLEKHIDLNDLLKIWRKRIFKTLDDFLTSVEHAAFYLQSPQASGIEKPKGWFYSNLSKGFFAPPAGFISWEEKQQATLAKAKREKVERLRLAREKELQDEFEIWLYETPREKKVELLKKEHSSFDGNIDSFGVKMLLRKIFNQGKGEGRDEF